MANIRNALAETKINTLAIWLNSENPYPYPRTWINADRIVRRYINGLV